MAIQAEQLATIKAKVQSLSDADDSYDVAKTQSDAANTASQKAQADASGKAIVLADAGSTVDTALQDLRNFVDSLV